MKTKNLLSTLTILLFNSFAYTQPGKLDISFKQGKGANSTIYTTSILSDGKIVIGGEFSSYNGATRGNVARLNTDGSLDTSFNSGSGVVGNVNTTSTQNDGKIIIGGEFISYKGVGRRNIARLNVDGSLDTTFNPGTGANSYISTTFIQSDGKIIIGGNFSTYNGTARSCIARLNTDGSLDTSFNPGTGANNTVRAISIQIDGKIIIGGSFNFYNGTARNRIARLNTDGSIDNSFNPGTGTEGSPSFLLSTSIQSDGKIIIGGEFSSYNGTARNRIARLNIDGSLDNTFNPGTGPDIRVLATSIQSDGKIIVGGEFYTYNGTASSGIARLNVDGSLDTTFNPGTGTGMGFGINRYIYTILIQSDGKIIIGGSFDTYNGTSRSRIARIFGSDLATSIPSFDKNESRFNIFPNPFSSNTTLQSDHLIKDGTLTVYNSLGEIVTQITNINGQSVSINRGNLANGLYFIRLTEGKHEIMMKKVIVVD